MRLPRQKARPDPARAAALSCYDEQALEIARTAEKRRFDRGENVVEQDKTRTRSSSSHGRARALATDARWREVSLALLRPGDDVAYMSLIDNELHSATVRA